MNARRQVLRRIGAAAARTGAVGAAAMVLVTVWGMSLSGVPQASAAATDAGPAQVVAPFDGTPGAGQPLDAGGSATEFSLLLPTGAACTGDSANAGYRVQGYMVPAAVAPGSLTFDATGPVPNGLGASFRQPLYTALGSGFVDAQTSAATVAGGPGPVVNIPALSLGVFSPGNIPAGEYNLGVACTLGTASATQLDRFWNVTMTIASDAADAPAGVTWTVSESATTTTTTSGSTTTTTTGGTTTTTAGGTTTTTDASTTTTTGDGSTTTTVFGGGSPSGTSVAGSITSLPVTGSSTMSLIVWSALLVIFGRIALLLGRPPRVRPARA
jgi:hypothetical protein